MSHTTTALVLLLAICSCSSASSASHDAALMDAAVPDAPAMDGTRDTTPSEPAPTSPIATFSLTNGNWCGGMPLACDVVYTATRAGDITYGPALGASKTAMFTDADRARFTLFLDDPTTVASVWDTTPCPMGTLDAYYTVRLTLESGQGISRDINGCKGAPYDAMWAWVATIKGYFPAQ